MMYPQSWNEFIDSETYKKINEIMEKDGWEFNTILQSGIMVVEPKKKDASNI